VRAPHDHRISTGLCVAALLGVLALPVSASANHVRPKGATPVSDSLVVAYQPCTPSGNRIHGGGLPFPSCNPPVQSSPWLTVGSPPNNGLPAKFLGLASYLVCPVMPLCAGQSGNIEIIVDATDVRCRPALFAESPQLCEGSAPLGTYGGELQLVSVLRITDDCNSPAPSPGVVCVGNDAATVIEIPFPATMSCSAGHCGVSTTFNAIVPGAVVAGAKMNIGLGQTQVLDGGSDGMTGTPDNSVFATEGIFVP
jgi:hypothetical protein